MQIMVLGLGYVGCVTSACLARLGHHVIGVDRDPYKVSQVERGEAPFYEPGLAELVREGRQSGNLSSSVSIATDIDETDVVLICVGTPSEKNGNLGLDQLSRVSAEIAALTGQRSKPLVVAIRSTVFPGTAEALVIPQFAGQEFVSVVSNPEFLREGTAIQDFEIPSLVVVGGEDRRAVEMVAKLYEPLGVQACLVSLRTAEMIKYSCNAFHALKISFANEVGALSHSMGISAHEVMETLCADTRLNISPAYLRPGFAFGGSCLPKDLRALIYRANRLDLKLPLLESVLPSNQRHLERGIQTVMDTPGRLGIVGLAFKENTDDLRESPVVSLIEYLLGKGRELRIYDPHIQLDQIYGQNRSFVLTAIPHIGKLMVTNPGELTAWAETIVIAQKPSEALAGQLRASGLPVIDLVDCRLFQAS